MCLFFSVTATLPFLKRQSTNCMNRESKHASEEDSKKERKNKITILFQETLWVQWGADFLCYQPAHNPQ